MLARQITPNTMAERVFNHRLAGGLEPSGRLPTILYHGNVSGANPREMT